MQNLFGHNPSNQQQKLSAKNKILSVFSIGTNIYNRANSGQNLLIQCFILIRESFHFSKKFKKESAEEEYLNQTSDVDSSECLSNYSEDREADLSDSLTSMSSASNGCYGSSEKVSLVYHFPNNIVLSRVRIVKNELGGSATQ